MLKKIFFLLFAFIVCSPGVGAPEIVSCGDGGSYFQISGKTNCVQCGEATKGVFGIWSERVNIYYKQCSGGVWGVKSVVPWCINDECTNTAKAMKILVNTGEALENNEIYYCPSGGVEQQGQALFAAGALGCYYYACNNKDYPRGTVTERECDGVGDKKAEKCKMKCVDDGDKARGRGSMWEFVEISKCKPGYKPAKDGKTCVYVGTAKKKGDDSGKTNCEASGGSYKNKKCTCSAANTVVENNACVCKSGYEWVKDSDKSQGCKMTDVEALKSACSAAAPAATWNEDTSTCVCVNVDQTFNKERKECIDNEDYAKCKILEGLGEATWYSSAKKCVCKKEGYVVKEEKCVEGDELIKQREDAERAEKVRLSRRKINDAHDNLKKKIETFKVSVWKDNEGKFNTARLASDTIAGVVLGTVGGAVTSKVVKKNQVEDGFEDLKCSIAGQTVADWGDEFSVGMQ